jgi:hypothetical protein
MTMLTSARAAGAALLAFTLFPIPAVQAEVADYAFQLVDKTIHQGTADVSVRLVRKVSGELVPDAVIFSTRFDMAPDRMAMMTAPVETMPSTEPGIYRFKLSPSMPGGWRLSLSAKVQGETGTLKSEMTFKVEP